MDDKKTLLCDSKSNGYQWVSGSVIMELRKLVTGVHLFQ